MRSQWLHCGHTDLRCPWIVYISRKKFSSRFMLWGEVCPGNINARVIRRETTKILSVAETNQHRHRKHS